MDSKEKHEQKYEKSVLRKKIWKCLLQNTDHFVEVRPQCVIKDSNQSASYGHLVIISHNSRIVIHFLSEIENNSQVGIIQEM